MKRFRTAARIAFTAYAPWDDFWYEEVPTTKTYSGITTSPDGAMRIGVSNACIRTLATAVAMLPCILYERLANGGKRRAEENPVYSLLHERPNEYQTPYEFKAEVVQSLAARGNAYVEKVPAGRSVELWPIHADDIVVDWFDRRSGRRRVYDVQLTHDGRSRVLLDDQVWHPHLLSLDRGLTGGSPVTLHAEGLGIMRAAEIYSARFFGNDARPGGFLTTEQHVTKKSREEFKIAREQLKGGVLSSHEPALFGDGVKFQTVTVTPNDAQLIEVMQWGVADCARVWGIPLFLLQEEKAAWEAGVEQRMISFVTMTLAPWLTLLEEGISSNLIVDSRRYFAEFLVDALLRGDLASRYEALFKAVGGPWMSRDEARRIENMEARGGEHDAIDRPANMAPVGTRAAVPTNGGDEGAVTATFEGGERCETSTCSG
jgi:HK97 family phage portal protein